MSRYGYLKKEAVRFSPRRRVWPWLLVGLGLFLVGNAVYPIVFYQLFVSPRFNKALVSPEVGLTGGFGPPQVLGNEIALVDLTKPSNWFPADERWETVEEGESYQLSIPKLSIEDAQVIIGGDDLKKSLIQYPGTSLPCQVGNPVIFGHSVLPQFFNPKNYTTIFSTMPAKLRPGDEVIAKYGGMTCRYLVESMVEMGPNDLSILVQRYDDAYLTLVTCVPPGTYLKRLVVRARLTKA